MDSLEKFVSITGGNAHPETAPSKRDRWCGEIGIVREMAAAMEKTSLRFHRYYYEYGLKLSPVTYDAMKLAMSHDQ